MRYFIKTFGCQMNESDSEKIAQSLEFQGFNPAQSTQRATLIIINTCSVRQSAEDRVLGFIKNLDPSIKIILTGCMLGLHGEEKLKKILPSNVEFKKIKDLLLKEDCLSQKNLISQNHAYVTIMEGCDSFCSYCVVPYSRGREVSRSIKEIISEVKKLVENGSNYIILLGQNVNSFKPSFSDLLKRISQIPGIQKLTFLTSNPQDFSDELIDLIAENPKIDRFLHIPVQSGDDEILRRMNRKYTAAQYKRLIKKIRTRVPDSQISTDIIVGFPDETEKAFQNTVDLCRQINFAAAYIARYSPRPKTAAAKFQDDVPAIEKKRRWKILEDLINKKNFK